MFEAGDVRIEDVPDARIVEPTDAVITVTRACICGSDLWPYQKLKASEGSRVMGHEAIGIVESVGRDVSRIKAGDFVIMPFAFSDGTCDFCHEHLQTSCAHGGFFGTPEIAGAQAEAVRVPLADGTLFALPLGKDDALMASLLTLSDVMGTGHHAAITAKVQPGKTVELWATGRLDCVACLLRADSEPSRSFFSAVTPPESRSRKSSARPTLSASEVTRQLSACVRLVVVWAFMPFSNVWVTVSRWTQR
jgi:threonine dehydrogenase-like Zn-dependent dehydrogenase